MKILVEVADNQAEDLLKILLGMPNISAVPLTDTKAEILSEVREAVEEMKLIRKKKETGRDAEDFLNEL